MAVPSLPPPRPKSPPVYPDLYGKRRELAKVQMLEREIGFLQEELKSIEGLQHASHCCKEIAEFTDANADPFIPTKQKVHNSCRFWKWLCGRSCFNISWACCFGCSPLKMPRCCTCSLRDCTCNLRYCRYCPCTIPKCSCCSWPGSRCFKNFSCRRICCLFQCRPSCPDCSCTKWKCCFPKCPKVHLRSCCTENCCYRYCLCC